MKAISAKVPTPRFTKIYKIYKIYKLGKADDRIPVLQLTRSRVKSKTKAMYESRKMVLNQAQD